MKMATTLIAFYAEASILVLFPDALILLIGSFSVLIPETQSIRARDRGSGYFDYLKIFPVVTREASFHCPFADLCT